MALSKESISQLPEQDQEAIGRILLDDLARTRRLRKAAAGPRYFLMASLTVTALAWMGFWAIPIAYHETRNGDLLPFVFVFMLGLIYWHARVFQSRLNAIIELLKIDTATTSSSEFKRSLETAADITKQLGRDA